MPSLEVNPDTVRLLIQRARIFQAKEGEGLPDENGRSSGDIAADMLTDQPRDPTESEFKTLVDELPPDQQAELVALTWLGRGNYALEEWDAAVEQARREWTPHTGSYLLATPLVAEYLAEGLALLGYSTELR